MLTTRRRPLPLPTFEVGDRVFRKYRGGVKWTPGLVSAVRLVDGGCIAYDVDYGGGGHEPKVEPRLLRPAAAAAGWAHRQDRVSGRGGAGSVGEGWFFAAGDAVEARAGGAAGRGWFPATVLRRCGDGRWDVRFDDGDAADGLAACDLREPRAGHAPARPPARASWLSCFN